MSRIMIAGTHSGCGKTTVTCAVLQAFVNRKIKVTAFKCGPDYIDPMFHNRITGIPSCNLDRKFCSKDTLNQLLLKRESELSVIEGVMGFYDGADSESSSCGISLDTGTPVVIVMDCKGMSLSIGAVMKGYLYFSKNNIVGFIFNRLPESLTEQTKMLCKELNTTYLGRMPNCPESVIESRHLGLVMADEIDDIKHKTQILAEQAEKSICLDKLLEIAKTAPKISAELSVIMPVVKNPLRIAVAKDNAFCFYYEENFDMLRDMGCEIVYFSPLNNKNLPENISGLWIGGGYPELYAKQLSENTNMKKSIKLAVNNHVPTIAECGGFMYLCENISDKKGCKYDMVGVINGNCYPTEKLQRFGYAELTALSDNLLCKKGEKLMMHEFHYWDCSDNGSSFSAERSRGRNDFCVHASNTLYAGFPHLYLYGFPKVAQKFVKKCLEYHENEKNRTNKAL